MVAGYKNEAHRRGQYRWAANARLGIALYRGDCAGSRRIAPSIDALNLWLYLIPLCDFHPAAAQLSARPPVFEKD